MAKEVVWSPQADQDRKAILEFWTKHNKSDAYSKKLDSLIRDSVQLISQFPKIGRESDLKNIRVKVVRDYLIIYEEHADRIDILTIWGSKQDPNELKQNLT